MENQENLKEIVVEDNNININLEISDDMDLVWKETEMEQLHKNDIIECVLDADDEDGDDDEDVDGDEYKIVSNFNSDSYSSDDQDIDDDIEEELENDLSIFNKLVKHQMDIRHLLFKQVLKTYIKPFKNTESPKLSLIHIRGIKKMAEKLELENHIGSMIADILFNEKIQIVDYKDLLIPFLVGSLSQKHFLNMILIIFNRHRSLLKYCKVVEIFESMIENRLINTCALIDWYQSLENNTISSVDKIVNESVYEFLDELIAGL
jgi:hypothetical protein